jgi:hypothetical protein
MLAQKNTPTFQKCLNGVELTNQLPKEAVAPLQSVCMHSANEIQITLHHVQSAFREPLEQYIKTLFLEKHNAQIHHFLPTLMALSNQDKQLLAVCGLSSAHENTLFLECYLDQPIEQILSTISGKSISRHHITEIGNLAVASPENIRCLLTSIHLQLHKTDAEWAVFTGIRSLKNALTKLNIPTISLGVAKLDSLPEHERKSWGSYYDENPEVLAIQRV